MRNNKHHIHWPRIRATHSTGTIHGSEIDLWRRVTAQRVLLNQVFFGAFRNIGPSKFRLRFDGQSNRAGPQFDDRPEPGTRTIKTGPERETPTQLPNQHARRAPPNEPNPYAADNAPQEDPGNNNAVEEEGALPGKANTIDGEEEAPQDEANGNHQDPEVNREDLESDADEEENEDLPQNGMDAHRLLIARE